MNDAELIKLITSGVKDQRRAIQYFFDTPKWKNKAKYAANQLGGTKEDQEDILTESIVILVRNIIENKFLGNSSLLTYFNSICYNVGKVIVNKGANIRPQREDLEILISGLESPYMSDGDIMALENQDELSKLLDQLMGMVGESCMRVLILKKMQWPNDRIANELGSTVKAITVKVSRCYSQLRENLNQNKELKDQLSRFL